MARLFDETRLLQLTVTILILSWFCLKFLLLMFDLCVLRGFVLGLFNLIGVDEAIGDDDGVGVSSEELNYP